jgi:arylsulfatase A-like enzyme
MDITRSLLVAAGAVIPPELQLEGVDILSVLAGRLPETERTLFWKTLNPPRAQGAVRSGDWKLVLDAGNPMLFNLRSDIGEREDLINREPAIARRLYALYSAWEKEVIAEARKR